MKKKQHNHQHVWSRPSHVRTREGNPAEPSKTTILYDQINLIDKEYQVTRHNINYLQKERIKIKNRIHY